jgi:hypothetical protein
MVAVIADEVSREPAAPQPATAATVPQPDWPEADWEEILRLWSLDPRHWNVGCG